MALPGSSSSPRTEGEKYADLEEGQPLMSSQEFELDCSQQGPAQVRTVLPQRRLGRFLFFQHKWPCLGVSAAAGTLIIVLLLAGLSAPAPAPSSLVPPSHSTPLAIQSSSTNLTQAIESPYHSSSHTESTTSSATAAAAATPATNFMNTRPPLPQLIPRPAAPNERFLSYLPHSGFHNQRIALTNAILLANMLNRTLLVPPARLGQAQGWKDKKTLQKILQTDQKTPNKVQECLDDQGLFKVQHTQHSQFCKTYDEYIEVSWSMLIDVQHTNSQVPLVSRSDISQNWLTSKDGLNIPEDSILQIDDRFRYDYKLYAAQQGLDHVDSNSHLGLDNFHYALPIADFLTPVAQNMRLIEFGSLYGSYRINLEGADPKWQSLLNTIQKSMAFEHGLLQTVSDDLQSLLGGRGAYIGVHLRVGDGAFKNSSQKRMRSLLVNLLRKVYRYNTSRANRLAQQAATTKSQSAADVRTRQISHSTSSTLAPGTRLQCARPLYEDPSLTPLNAPLFIATDSHHPREDPDLKPFFALFPCAFVLADLEPHSPSLERVHQLYSQEEGLPLFDFLAPFVDGMVAARAVNFLGTSGSTFSRYIVTTLHPKFWPDKEEQDESIALLWRQLREPA